MVRLTFRRRAAVGRDAPGMRGPRKRDPIFPQPTQRTAFSFNTPLGVVGPNDSRTC
jgi:hypothetical protein